MIKYVLPMYVDIPKLGCGKHVPLNLNGYRNWHYQKKNAVKQAFAPISGAGFSANKISISYHIEKTTKRKFDIMNIGAIVDKFFCDWLVANGRLLDDDLNHVVCVSFTGENNCEESRVIAWVEIIE